jgi:hypothetical protein
MKLYEFFSVPSLGDSENKDHTNDKDGEREQLANDLYWYILDNDHLHKKHFFPIAHEINAQVKKDKDIDKKKYTECWLPMVKEGALMFYKQMQLKGNPKKIFDKEMCEHICKRIAERHLKDIAEGQYDLGD